MPGGRWYMSLVGKGVRARSLAQTAIAGNIVAAASAPPEYLKALSLLEQYMALPPASVWSVRRTYPALINGLLECIFDMDRYAVLRLVGDISGMVQAERPQAADAQDLLKSCLTMTDRSWPQRAERRALLADRFDATLVLDRYLAALPPVAERHFVSDLILRRGPRGEPCHIVPDGTEPMFLFFNSSEVQASHRARLSDLASAYHFGVPMAATLVYPGSSRRTTVSKSDIAHTFASLQVVGPPELLLRRSRSPAPLCFRAGAPHVVVHEVSWARERARLRRRSLGPLWSPLPMTPSRRRS